MRVPVVRMTVVVIGVVVLVAVVFSVRRSVCGRGVVDVPAMRMAMSAVLVRVLIVVVPVVCVR
jgi:hypothetical protein